MKIFISLAALFVFFSIGLSGCSDESFTSGEGNSTTLSKMIGPQLSCTTDASISVRLHSADYSFDEIYSISHLNPLQVDGQLQKNVFYYLKRYDQEGNNSVKFKYVNSGQNYIKLAFTINGSGGNFSIVDAGGNNVTLYYQQ